MPVRTVTFTGIADDTGLSATDRITFDQTLILSFTYTRTGNDRDWVQIWIRTSPSGTWTAVGTPYGAPGVGVDGSFSRDTITLPEGTYEVGWSRANRISDLTTPPSGQVFTAQPIVVDTTPPLAPELLDPDGIFGDDEINPPEAAGGVDFVFRAEIGSQLNVTFDGVRSDISFGPLTVGRTGEVTITLSETQIFDLGGGPLQIRATATDVAGNVSPQLTVDLDNNPCFLTGTRIATARGEVAVEDLAPGDVVLTADGRALPVRFVGRRAVITRFASPETSYPVCIAAGALGENLPVRDLFVSPAHAFAFGDVLVQAGALVNGTTIRRVTDLPPTFTYWHVELAEHALLLAEGAAAESFIDSVEPGVFHNAAERPDVPPMAQLDMPRARSHRQVPQHVRALIAERAAALAPQDAAAA